MIKITLLGNKGFWDFIGICNLFNQYACTERHAYWQTAMLCFHLHWRHKYCFQVLLF